MKDEGLTKKYENTGLENIISAICMHQLRFGHAIKLSALVLNFSNVYSIEHLYQVGQSMNSLPSQILERY